MGISLNILKIRNIELSPTSIIGLSEMNFFNPGALTKKLVNESQKYIFVTSKFYCIHFLGSYN